MRESLDFFYTAGEEMITGRFSMKDDVATFILVRSAVHVQGVLEIGKAYIRKVSWKGVGIISPRTNEKLDMGKSEVIGLLSKEKNEFYCG